MAKKELYRLDSFVFESETEDDNNGITLIVRNIADTWRMEFTERNPHQYFWLQMIEEAKHRLMAREALDATFSILFAMSGIGVYDDMMVNDVAVCLEKAHNRIATAMSRIDDTRTEEEKSEDAKDDAEWAERAERLEDMKANEHK